MSRGCGLCSQSEQIQGSALSPLHPQPPSLGSRPGAPSPVLGLVSWQAWRKRQLCLWLGHPQPGLRAAGSPLNAGTVPGGACEPWLRSRGRKWQHLSLVQDRSSLSSQALLLSRPWKRKACPHSWTLALWLSLTRAPPDGHGWLAILPVFPDFQCVHILLEMDRSLPSPGMRVQPKFPRNNNNHSSHHRDLGVFKPSVPFLRDCLQGVGARKTHHLFYAFSD